MVFSSHMVTFRTRAYITDLCLLVAVGRFILMWIHPSPSINPAAQAMSVFFIKISQSCPSVMSRLYRIWWHDEVMKARHIVLIRGRMRFGGSQINAPFPSCVVVFSPRPGGLPLFTTMDRILDEPDTGQLPLEQLA
jgi:hypothetical protein